MANKKTNEILEEQRRARQEFLKLKQMQQGEIAPEPKPSEVAYVPRTFSEKLSNFWFQYKLAVISIVVTVALLAVLISQCASRVDYDLEILYFTYSPTLDYQTKQMAEYFEKFTPDVNGDGEVNVAVLNCSISKDNRDVQYRNTVFTKVQTVMVGNEKSLLSILDPESLKYFDGIKMEGGIFESEPFELGDDFYEAIKTEKLQELPKEFSVYLRKISGTAIAKNKDVEKYLKASKELLENLKNGTRIN